MAGSVVASAQYTYYLPQVAIGSGTNVTWQTTIFLTNATAPGTAAASGSVTFNQDDGSAFNVSFVDLNGNPVGSGNTIGFQLNPQATAKYTSTNTGSLVTGFATVTANAAVLGGAMFAEYDAYGNLISSAGVPLGIPLNRQAIFTDTTNGNNAGVAIANPNTDPLTITFLLEDSNGNILMTTQQTVNPLGHTAFFVTELFPSAPPLVGRLEFYCLIPMVSIGLQFDPSMTKFTTLTPIAVADLFIPSPSLIPAMKFTEKRLFG
jgi:hypothetical protein